MNGFKPQGPIHVNPFGDATPHLTVRDIDGEMWHVPYVGQTTLDMFERPTFDPRQQWENIARHDLGYLDATRRRRG